MLRSNINCIQQDSYGIDKGNDITPSVPCNSSVLSVQYIWSTNQKTYINGIFMNRESDNMSFIPYIIDRVN
jgi:hypothetical protein